MASVTPDQLAERIHKVLEEYADEVEKTTADCVKAVAKQGVRALKANSPKGKKGDYAKKWTAQIEEGRLYTTATIYEKKPGLTQLLEFGHVSRNGTGRTYGFVEARPHIASVEQTIVAQYTQTLTQELR